MTAPIADPSEKNWKPFIDHNPAVKINGLTFFANHIVVSEREGGLTQLRVIDPKTSSRIASRPTNRTSRCRSAAIRSSIPATVRFNYQSMVTPSSVYDYDMTTRAAEAAEAAGSPRRLRSVALRGEARLGRRARRHEGADVGRAPKGIALDGKAPLLLYGYGSYGASMAPTFSSNRLSLLDRGVVFAIAYIRGGGEMGEEWREQGRMMQKMNTFTDFIDCAEYLVKTATPRPTGW